MKTRFKEALRWILPPIVLEWRRRLKGASARGTTPFSPMPESAIQAAGVSRASRAKPEWEAVPDSDEAWVAREGWSHQSIADTQRAKWRGFLDSIAANRPFGWPHEAALGAPADISAHNTIITFGYVLGRAAIGKERLSVLDWGGGIGHYYVYAQRLMPELNLDYVIKDLPPLCTAGRDLIPGATFVSDEAQALARRYDLVFASSSLQYNRDFYGTLERLCQAASGWLFVTRSPFVREHDDFVVVQRPYAYGYLTEYAAWFVNRDRFIAFVEAQGLVLEREFLLGERPSVPNAPEQCVYSGFLFRRTAVLAQKASQASNT